MEVRERIKVWLSIQTFSSEERELLVDAESEIERLRAENEKLTRFAKVVYGQPNTPADLHDYAAMLLGEPSLSHGESEVSDG